MSTPISSRPMPRARKAPEVQPTDSPTLANQKRRLQSLYDQYFQARKSMDRNEGNESYKVRYHQIQEQISKLRSDIADTQIRDRKIRESKEQQKQKDTVTTSSFLQRAAMTKVTANAALIQEDFSRIQRLPDVADVQLYVKDGAQATYYVYLPVGNSLSQTRRLTGNLQTLFGSRLRSSGTSTENGRSYVDVRVTLLASV